MWKEGNNGVPVKEHALNEALIGEYKFYSQDMDWDIIRAKLGWIKWYRLLPDKDDIDKQAQIFIEICQEICDKYITKSKPMKKDQTYSGTYEYWWKGRICKKDWSYKCGIETED